MEITLQTIIEDCHQISHDSKLMAPLGTSNDKVEYADFSKISNLLVCGTTGSGKTTFVRTLLATLIAHLGPDQFKLCIFDSRHSDYIEFSHISHLYCPVCHDAGKTYGLISSVFFEAERRKDLLDNNIADENFPDLFLILDDYSQIAQDNQKQDVLCKLLQISHRVKIHVIIVTSIALAKIISTELKACIPHRITFFLPERRNSQVVIDQNGAEKLKMPGQFIAKFYSNCNTYDSVELSDSEIKGLCKQHETQSLDKDAVKKLLAT